MKKMFVKSCDVMDGNYEYKLYEVHMKDVEMNVRRSRRYFSNINTAVKMASISSTHHECKSIVINVNEKLIVEVDSEVMFEVFERDFDALMLEVEMVIEHLGDDVMKNVRFEKNDENYDVYLNGTKYEFDY